MKTKKDLVVLFYPKTESDNIYRNLPLAVLKIASQLLACGYRLSFIDARFDKDYKSSIQDSIKEALCIGISCMTGYQIYDAINASRIAKELNNDIPVVWGGWHPSLLPDETIRNDFIDILVRGQGENTFVEVLNALNNGYSLEGIGGVSFKDSQRGIIHNPARPMEDINNFSPVNFDVLDINRYVNETPLGKRTIFWNTSQGCPYTCGFCCTHTLYSRRWISLKVERIIKEIETLVRRFNIDGILFTEDNFFTDKNRVKEICEELIRRDIKIRWSTDARVDQIIHYDDAFLRLLKKSGCMKLYLGAESGDQEVLDFIDKDIKVEYTYRAAQILADHGIIGEFLLMLGFPLDPQKDLEKTLEMMKEIKKRFPNHQATPFLYTPYPGTKLFNFAVKNGLTPPNKLEEWIPWSSLEPTVPWVNKKYLDYVNRLIKFYLPFAYPSESLKSLMKKRLWGLFYKLTHRIAKFRLENNLFSFTAEWYIAKYFYYNIKLKYNLFKKIAVPR